jgi:hypothetical protein
VKKMATLSDHVTAVQAAITAAYEDGYILQGWPDDYDGIPTQVDLVFVKNRRINGVMRNEQQAKITAVYL